MYQSFIGLEIHIQLSTESKVFCSCKSYFGDEPNSHICPVCMGYPGTLPTLNKEAIRKGYAVAKALHCSLTERSLFERKSYYYPDMPKNYQISQFAAPLGTLGYIEFECGGEVKRARIHEAHLEEDAGKMIHVGEMSLLDYNRAGTSLLEIVTSPDLSTGEEAEALVHELRRLVRAMGVCDGNMEDGSMRADANISINTPGAGLGRKVEVKNLNSSRFIRKAIAYEIGRQAQLLDRGERVIQETRLWNENRDQTESMRNKESSHDYRFFPEPDLPPFMVDQEFLKSLDEFQVEAPLARKHRFIREYGIPAPQADILCEHKPDADYFEAVAAKGIDVQTLVAWMNGDVRKVLNRIGPDASIASSALTVERFSRLLGLLQAGKISGKIAKQVLELIFEQDKDPDEIVKDLGLETISDGSVILAAIEESIAENPKAWGELRSGDKKPFGFVVGKIMKKTGGRADPSLVNSLLEERIQRP